MFEICAETQSDADLSAQAVDVRRLQMAYGLNAPIPSLDEARARMTHLSKCDRAIIEHERPLSMNVRVRSSAHLIWWLIASLN